MPVRSPALWLLVSGWLLAAATAPPLAQEVVWVPPVTSPTDRPLPPGTVSPWTPYRDPANRIELLPPVDFNLEQDSFASEPIADLDPVTPGGNRKKPSFGRAAPVKIGRAHV